MKLVSEPLEEYIENSESLNEREFNTKQRREMAEKGEALPDGSFPIASVKDLKNAIKSYGRSKNKEQVKAHIKKRAKALGHTDLIPAEWK
jgi:hypothetical protein